VACVPCLAWGESALSPPVGRDLLGDVDLVEAEAVEQGGDGGAGVFAGGVEDPVSEGGLLDLLLGLGAGIGFEIWVGGDQDAGGTEVDAAVLVVERGDEELRGGEGDVNRLAVDADVLGLQLAQIDPGYRLAMHDEQDAVTCQEVGQNGAGFGAFHDGVDGVDDGFESVEALDALDDGRDGGVEGGGAASDGGGDSGQRAGGGVAKEDSQGSGAEEQREKNGE